MIRFLIKKPINIFKIDGFGAFISAFMLCFVLVRLNRFIGLTEQVLGTLAVFPIIFALFDMISLVAFEKHLVTKIKIIAYANLVYCIVTLFVLTTHFMTLAIPGFIYFTLELIVIIALVKVELRLASELKKSSNLKGKTK